MQTTIRDRRQNRCRIGPKGLPDTGTTQKYPLTPSGGWHLCLPGTSTVLGATRRLIREFGCRTSPTIGNCSSSTIRKPLSSRHEHVDLAPTAPTIGSYLQSCSNLAQPRSIFLGAPWLPFGSPADSTSDGRFFIVNTDTVATSDEASRKWSFPGPAILHTCLTGNRRRTATLRQGFYGKEVCSSLADPAPRIRMLCSQSDDKEPRRCRFSMFTRNRCLPMCMGLPRVVGGYPCARSTWKLLLSTKRIHLGSGRKALAAPDEAAANAAGIEQ